MGLCTGCSLCRCFDFKEARAQKIELKSTYLKIWLEVRVLAKKFGVKWHALKHFLTTYLKRWKMHVIWGKSVLCPWTKMISPHNKWYIGNVLVCAHFSSKQAHYSYCLCSITQLFRLLGIFKLFPMLMPKPCSGGFKTFVCHL